MKELKAMIADVIDEIESESFNPNEWIDDYYVESLLYSVDGELQGVEVIVAGNGPTITVNTKYRCVVGTGFGDLIIDYYRDRSGLNASMVSAYHEALNGIPF
jgi:hypothetical protein